MTLFKWFVPGCFVAAVLAENEEQARVLAAQHMLGMGLDFTYIEKVATLTVVPLDKPGVVAMAQV